MKIRFLLGIILTALLLGVCGAALYGYVSAARTGTAAIRTVAAQPAGEVAPGAPVAVAVELLVPWGQTIHQIDLQPGAGITVAGKPTERLTGVSWRGRHCQVAAVLKAYRAGRLDGGTLKITLERPMFTGGARLAAETVTLPELTVVTPEIAADAELPIAGALSVPADGKKHWFIMAAAVAIVLAALAGAFRYARRRARRTPAPRTPWEVAAEALADLRRDARAGQRPVNWCVARLTDVVRDYLSLRFQLPVSRQTTGEFLHSLKRPDSPLTAAQGRNLADFLNAADLVKFAGQTPERGYLESAIDRAERLVEETRPREPEPPRRDRGEKED